MAEGLLIYLATIYGKDNVRIFPHGNMEPKRVENEIEAIKDLQLQKQT